MITNNILITKCVYSLRGTLQSNQHLIIYKFKPMLIYEYIAAEEDLKNCNWNTRIDSIFWVCEHRFLYKINEYVAV